MRWCRRPAQSATLARTSDAAAAETGSAAVELVLATPVVVALMLLAVAGGRLSSARGQIDAAARDSARAASLARSPIAAQRDGQAAAEAALNTDHVTCRTVKVSVDVSDFQPGGTVTSTVTCAVELADLTGLGLPGTRAISSRFVEPVDPFRGVVR